ncbi:preprotein translocase subunit YajC [Deltaproteobacteria bacterium TL4]
MFPFESIAVAQEAGGPAGIAANPFFQFLPFVLIFFVFYFLIIRPQQKKQKEHTDMLRSLKKGDKVVTSGGIYGTIQKIGEDWLTLEIAEKVRIKVDRNQVSRLTVESVEKNAKEEAKSENNDNNDESAEKTG